MRETIDVSGVVLLAQPIGEFDKRLIILTRERGKLTVFARGARRQHSAYLATCNPFVFANFHLYEGKSAYSFAGAEVVEYFTDLSAMQPGVWYGFYFLELASYYAKEGMEAESMVNLIYLALRAILRQRMSVHLIRRVFELRLMAENGDFAYPDEHSLMEETYRAALFSAGGELKHLFAFSLSEEAEHEFSEMVKRQLKRAVDRPMKSLLMLEMST